MGLYILTHGLNHALIALPQPMGLAPCGWAEWVDHRMVQPVHVVDRAPMVPRHHTRGSQGHSALPRNSLGTAGTVASTVTNGLSAKSILQARHILRAKSPKLIIYRGSGPLQGHLKVDSWLICHRMGQRTEPPRGTYRGHCHACVSLLLALAMS